MKPDLESFLKTEIQKAAEDFEKICKNDDDKFVVEDKRLKEISFLIEHDEKSIDEMLKTLTNDKVDELLYTVITHNLSAVVIIFFFGLIKKLKFNSREKLSPHKSRFDKQIRERKQTFDIAQRYSSEQEYKDLPRRDLDLLYGFREYLTRNEFCTDGIIRILLNLIGIKKLPQMPKEWKQLNREWRENIVSSLKDYQKSHREKLLSENKFYLTDDEAEGYAKNFHKAIRRANQYKPKKL